MRPVAVVTGILGGLCLVVRHFLDDPDVLQWAGIGLLGVAALCLGLLLVPKAPIWLQAIVGVGVVCLFGSVLATLHGELDPDVVDLGVGVAAVLLFAWLALRWKAARTPRTHGSHSR